MRSYDIKCHISIRDWGDIEETIIFNKYGAKNIMFQRSDFTFYRSYLHAFIAHNIFFTWGDIHYHRHAEDYFIDHQINIGCIYGKNYSKAMKNSNDIIQQINLPNKANKTVSFFDASFAESTHFTISLYFEFLDLIRDYCTQHKDVNVLLKSKNDEDTLIGMVGDQIDRYKAIQRELEQCKNFINVDPLKWNIEDIIAISDACITMGITSASTIALICGKDSLYFDNTGNDKHLFVQKYLNNIVFDDKKKLCQQIDNILIGKFKCRDVISEDEMRQYDAYGDDKAIARLQDYIYQISSGVSLNDLEKNSSIRETDNVDYSGIEKNLTQVNI